MGRIIIKVDWLPDNYAAAPANEGIACIATARSLEELKTNMLDALHMHLDWMREEDETIYQDEPAREMYKGRIPCANLGLGISKVQ